jgi:hypothetical protein
MNGSNHRQFMDYECRDRIATIGLNRPYKFNAVGGDVVRQLMAAFRRFDTDQPRMMQPYAVEGGRSVVARTSTSLSYYPARNLNVLVVRRLWCKCR